MPWMEQPIVIVRTVDLEMSPEDAWRLVGGEDGWSDWMVDEADVIIEPGAEGFVTDDGVERHIRVTEVAERERVSFDWWPSADEDATSTVELAITPLTGRVVLRIVETFPARARGAALAASIAWEARATGASIRCPSLVAA
jgi:hypothetical protein